LQLKAGAGWFKFEDRAGRAWGYIRVFYYVPERIQPASRILIALHGLDRIAAGFRDEFIAAAERLGKIVIVPEFDIDAFPDVYAYNYGNAVTAPPNSRPKAREEWNFELIDRLFLSVKNDTQIQSQKFDLYGNSAGSQYVLRYVALTEAPTLEKPISSNSGIYMLPTLTVNYPDGMGGIGMGDADIRRYLSRPLHILLGDADTDATAADLPRTPEALAQGPHRLARGLWHFEHCISLAETMGIELAWTIEIVPGAQHISRAIFDRAMAISG
jgi:poly(3-hydroxybutyrate) depolymerase